MIWKPMKLLGLLFAVLLLNACQTAQTNVQQVTFQSGPDLQLPLTASALLVMAPQSRHKIQHLTLQNLMGSQVDLREGRVIMSAGEQVMKRLFTDVQTDAIQREPDLVFVLDGTAKIDTFWLTYAIQATVTYYQADGTPVGSAKGQSMVAGSTAGSELTLEDAYVKAFVQAFQEMVRQPAFTTLFSGGEAKTAPLDVAGLQAAVGFPVDAPLLREIAAKELEQRLARDMTYQNASYNVKAGEAVIRQFPDGEAKALDRVAQGGRLHILGTLPDGWLQVAREGKPFGWVHESGLDLQGGRSVAAVRQYPSKPVAVQFRTVPKRPDDIAVIIGNADYAKAGTDIPAVEPAYADAAGFRDYALKALGVREGNIIDLRDATQADMISVFGTSDNHQARLFNWVRPGVSRVYVYYAGHGAPGGDGNAYLVPSDANPATLHLNGFRLGDLYANLSKIRARSVTVVLEACFSGSSEGGAVISNASPVFLKVAKAKVPKGISVIAAGAENQMASWDQDRKHSLFTKYFLKGMAGEADKAPHGNGDGAVGPAELERYLRHTVTYYARRYYGRDQQVQILEAGS